MRLMSRVIHVAATLDSANRKKDGSVRLAFTTMLEMPQEEFMIMDSFHQSAGHLMFRENAFKEEDIPAEDVEEDVEKSMSTQIRDALWVLYKAEGNDTADKDAFRSYYRNQQGKFKNRILGRVHEIEKE